MQCLWHLCAFLNNSKHNDFFSTISRSGDFRGDNGHYLLCACMYNIGRNTIQAIMTLHFFQQFAKTLSKGFKTAHQMGKAEVKVLFMISVYIIISSLLLVTITHAVVTREKFIRNIISYFSCQSQPGQQCDDDIIRRLQSTPFDTLLQVAIILEGLIPIFALIFVAKCTCNYKFKKLTQSTSWVQ